MYLVRGKFPVFLRLLLRTFYPALGNRIHCKCVENGIVDCVFGDSRDSSPLLPRLQVQAYRPHGPNTRAVNLRFHANPAWIADRQEDLRAFLGSGHLAIAMSLHRRLGSKIDCQMGKLLPELLHIIVNLLDS